MIAFGTAITDRAAYESVALPGIRQAREPDSLVLVREAMSLQRAYNEMLEVAGARSELEALALLHQDLEIVDPAFAGKIRAALEDPAVAAVGPLGARDIPSAAWLGGPSVGRGGIRFGDTVIEAGRPAAVGGCEVNVLDGALLVLSPWAVRTLRFDLQFERDFHFYDLDISFQARAHGRRLRVIDLRTIHGPAGHLNHRRGSWIRAGLCFEQKWGLCG